MRYLRFLSVLAMMSALAAPAFGKQVEFPERTPAEPAMFTQVGSATYYGGRHVGHETASGERLARHGLTAAHRTLPFGTVVRVTNLENGRVVKVRINDRGPYVRRRASRILDLSVDAATALGITRCGVAKIRIEEIASDQHVA
jgi:rare lipoprotein A